MERKHNMKNAILVGVVIGVFAIGVTLGLFLQKELGLAGPKQYIEGYSEKNLFDFMGLGYDTGFTHATIDCRNGKIKPEYDGDHKAMDEGRERFLNEMRGNMGME